MISVDWLKSLELNTEVVDEIFETDSLYGAHIAPLAKAYMESTEMVLKPYTQAALVAAKNEALFSLEKVQQLGQSEADTYRLPLLFWLHCIPYLERIYHSLGIDRKVLINSLMDITYKVRECKKNYGYCGVATPRFYQIFRCELFGLGRLQYQTLVHEKEKYSFGDYTVTAGDRIFGCHIPSAGRLTPELCMESLEQAYQFFKNDLKDHILPVCCSSWLLYPPYGEMVFADGSNLKAFYNMFDIVSESGKGAEFGASQIVFGMPYSGDVDCLPRETSLQRNFVSYIKSGGDFGSGYGILLYDGVEKRILTMSQK